MADVSSSPGSGHSAQLQDFHMRGEAKEARKLSEMENAGLLKLPAPPEGQPLGLGPSTGRRTRGIPVTTLKSRSRKKD